MPQLIRLTAAAALALLAGCGTSNFDRTTTGAGTGAATGATIGLLGGPVGAAAGALIGATAGAVVGSATDPKDVNLGKPIWQE
ncbi:glycine zipper domain-containing protein [Limobrevibacterium gyesilva]|uniref:Glycine zipper domain-containing protein n=1 Tax=Limobrevibacterium gyesilva TaxID=2991712 RepID=A0AA41YRZ6_9PROT|nr:glycine zipper domain-containing protein [Limobrevibacterium gyesilva]MCW3477626.1 glycine zipper domain-containing protein [Limobrevibacterium gyesilva]